VNPMCAVMQREIKRRRSNTSASLYCTKTDEKETAFAPVLCFHHWNVDPLDLAVCLFGPWCASRVKTSSLEMAEGSQILHNWKLQKKKR
jgi:hypothetical protein